MKSLTESIKSSIFENLSDNPKIEKWLKDNCEALSNIKLKSKGNKYIIDAEQIKFKSTATVLTNGEFEWGEVDWFDCSETNITALEGAPKKCNNFNCGSCNKLTSLEGCPEKCDTFICMGCENLTSFEGAPKECITFMFADCYKITSLKYAPKCGIAYYGNFKPNKLKVKFTRSEIEKATGAYKITVKP